MSILTSASPVVPAKLFAFDEDIRSAMVVDRLGNLVSFASRTKKPIDPGFVNQIGCKWTALLGGMLRGNEASFGVLEWVHLRYRKLHIYCWLVDGGYLVFTSRTQLEDGLLHRIGKSQFGRARYADIWGEGEPIKWGNSLPSP